MIHIQNRKECSGCTACASICAHDAITMEPDALGFLYPKVDKSKCIDCGLC
jgi:formate hydrogenlyase subunit 6/NADH:ubiquinone oxidoreductase subunit I